jgi:hypothetical protein
MKRRTFIILAGAGAAAIAIPFAIRQRHHNTLAEPLGHPDFLGHICDDATVRDIGMAYRSRNPNEMQEDELVSMLIETAGEDKRRVKTAIDSTRVLEKLDGAIRDDYAAGRVVTVKGWILSLTEARQCALYSLSHQ